MELYERLDAYEEEKLTERAKTLLYLSRAKIKLALEGVKSATYYLDRALKVFYIDETNFNDFFILSVFLNRLEVFKEAYKQNAKQLAEQHTLEWQLWSGYLRDQVSEKLKAFNLQTSTKEQCSLFCYIMGLLIHDKDLKEEYMRMAYKYYPCNLGVVSYLFDKGLLKETIAIKRLYENTPSLITKALAVPVHHEKIDFTFLPLGGGNDIGASCYLMTLGGEKLLIDAGCKFVGKNVAYPNFEQMGETIKEVKMVIITHAHLDHCGGIIKLYEINKKIIPIMTPETKALLKLNMAYALSREERLILEELLEKSITCPFNKPLPIGKSHLTIEFLRAGHILGAAAVLISNGQNKVLLTGDFSITDQKTVKGAQLPISKDIDVMIMESTCGSDENRQNQSRKLAEKQLEHYVLQKINEGKKVLIPAFAIGRAQELIEILKESAKKNDFRLYIDGSAIEVSRLYKKYGAGDILSKGIYEVPIKQYETRDAFIEQEFMHNRSCMIATSGMLQEGSTALAYAKYILQSKEGVCILTGYQADDTIGARLKAQMHMDCQRYIEIDGQMYPIKCELSEVNLSAHADMNELLASVTSVNPRYTILVHGLVKEGKSYLHTMLEQRKNLHVIQSQNGEEIIIKE